MSSHRHSILQDNPITTGYRLNYLANFFVEPVYAEIARRKGLARSEFVVIFCLHQLGTLTAQDVCAITGRPKNSISQAVTKLIQRELIEKQSDAGDARRAPMNLTALGQQVYEELIPLFMQREQSMLAVLSPREREQFERLLGKLSLRSDNWIDAS
jgi:MarR family transcriptional regulator, temperature-dependent positive regulator of motility